MADKFYFENLMGECVKCPDSCIECDAETKTCLACVKNMILNEDKICEEEKKVSNET